MSKIDEFIEQEIAGVSWLDKTTQNYPRIKSTSALCYSPKSATPNPEHKLTPSWFNKIFGVLFILFSLFFYTVLIGTLINGHLPTPVSIMFLLIISGMDWMVIWTFFVDPKMNYKIRLNKEYIELGSQRISWDDIEDTYIMTKMGGKNTETHLVIFRKGMDTRKFNISRFAIDSRKLASFIEQCKHAASAASLSKDSAL
ncbi:MAG TPA: hypothetical protein VI233_17690 [Puia sp.]